MADQAVPPAIHPTVLKSGQINGVPYDIIPVTFRNASQAIAIAAQCYPGALPEIVTAIKSSIRTRDRWNFAGAEHTKDIQHFILLLKGEPSGVTGLYVPKDQPNEAWLGMTGASYLYAGRGVEETLIDFAGERAAADRRDFILGVNRSYFSYANYCKSQTDMLAAIRNAERRHATQPAQAQAQRAEFTAKHGSIENYLADGRLIDISDDVARQERTSITESFASLCEALFPIVAERELVFAADGLKLFVQPDTRRQLPSERRIIVALDEKKEKTIGAIIFGVAVVPEALRQSDGVDAVFGITYRMVGEEYRAIGLSKALLNAGLSHATDFLSNNGITQPRIMLMSERNDPLRTAYTDSVDDFARALIDPVQRPMLMPPKRWVEGFPYIQVPLRQDLPPCEGVKLYVMIPGKDDVPDAQISSGLLRFAVGSYARLCLDKQQTPDFDGNPSWQSMQEALATRDAWQLGRPPKQFAVVANQLRAAMVHEAAGGLGSPGDAMMRDVVMHYSRTVYAHSS